MRRVKVNFCNMDFCHSEVILMHQIDGLIDRIRHTVHTHELGGGRYARWITQNDKGDRNLGPSEYGIADAVNILYTIADFPTGDGREAMTDALLALQDPESGLFREPTHHPLHTTAHCIAALELFDRPPLYPLTALKPYFTIDGLTGLLESLDWTGNPWPQSHQGAGIYVCGVLTNSVSEEWKRAYFDWIWKHSDPVYGMSRAGAIATTTAPVCHHLYGWFHYMFNLDYAREPLRYPEQLIDTCISLYDRQQLTPAFGREIGFMEIDWIFALNRAMRQTPHRWQQAHDRLLDMADRFIPWMESLDAGQHDGFNDLHMLFGAVCALAELQRALPGHIASRRPLRLVLDRRPFI